MKNFCLSLFIFSFLFAFNSYASSLLEGKAIKVVYANNWAPISYGDGLTASGLLPEKMEEILGEKFKMKVEHIAVPWGRAQKMIEIGSADAFVTTPTPARLKYSYASKSKVFFLPFVAAVKKETETERLIENPDDLSGLEDQLFCDVLGNGWADYFYKDKQVKLHIVPTINECLRLLNVGRVDAIIHAAPVLEKYVKDLMLEDTIRIMEKPSQKSPYFSILVSKNSIYGKKFIEAFDRLYKENYLQ